jgi:hypothetical protein
MRNAFEHLRPSKESINVEATIPQQILSQSPTPEGRLASPAGRFKCGDTRKLRKPGPHYGIHRKEK